MTPAPSCHRIRKDEGRTIPVTGYACSATFGSARMDLGWLGQCAFGVLLVAAKNVSAVNAPVAANNVSHRSL
jgi:hypothetical protein